MFMKPKTPMSADKVQPTWEYLVKLEHRLERNVPLHRIIQPVGTLIFLFNLLLATANFAFFLSGDAVRTYLEAVPILPGLVESFPRGSWGSVILFTVFFVYVIPLAVSGIITAIFYFAKWKKHHAPIEPLHGTEAECAKALVHQADTVYEKRKKILTWSTMTEAAILTCLTAIQLILACLSFVKGESAGVLQFSIGLLAVLVCLFGLFWLYVLLFKIFAILNAQFYYMPSSWSLFELYHKLDAYWESVDPEEFRRRENAEQERLAKKRSRRKKKSESEEPDYYDYNNG